MKLAVTASGSTLDALLDARFGRASYFMVVDPETLAHEAYDNVQNLNAAQGAGIQAAQQVAGFGVDAVITGHCGPKAFQVLTAAGISIVVGAQGTVLDAVNDYNKGVLMPVTEADVEGHWV